MVRTNSLVIQKASDDSQAILFVQQQMTFCEGNNGVQHVDTVLLKNGQFISRSVQILIRLTIGR